MRLTERLSINWRFEPRDCWIGLYWEKDLYWDCYFICLIPTLPIIFTHWHGRWDDFCAGCRHHHPLPRNTKECFEVGRKAWEMHQSELASTQGTKTLMRN